MLSQRRSIRIQEFDYSSQGAYFITLVSQNRANLFGEISAGEMRLNEWGQLVASEWQRLESRFSYVLVSEYVVMPNHLHGVICLESSAVGARRKQDVPSASGSVASPGVNGANHIPMENGPGKDRARLSNTAMISDSDFASPLRKKGLDAGTLGAIIGAYKSITTRLINGLRHTPGAPFWQRNYYEHVIRGQAEWQKIEDYIFANPAHWADDPENR